jgi:ribosomal protein S13
MGLVGVDLTKQKNYATSYLYSRNWSYICKKNCWNCNIDSETRVNDLTTEQSVTFTSNLRSRILTLKVILRRFNGLKRLNEINCHRGKRHRNNLPGGQRTRTMLVQNVVQRKLLLVRKNNFICNGFI